MFSTAAKRMKSLVLAGALALASLFSQPVPMRAAEFPAPAISVSFDQKNANDESTYKNNGTLHGSPGFVNGTSRQAISLVNSSIWEDPARQFVNFGHPPHLQPDEGSLTIMFWYRVSEFTSRGGTLVCNGYDPNNEKPGIAIKDAPEGIGLYVWSGEQTFTLFGRYNVGHYADWHHIAAVIDRTDTNTMSLYIDGIPAQISGEPVVESKDISSITGSLNAGDWLIGAAAKLEGGYSCGLNYGEIDSFELYKQAFSSSEILEEFKVRNCQAQINLITDRLAQTPAGDRYPQTAIDAMSASLSKAQTELNANPDHATAILEELVETYDQFMEGEPANLSFHVFADPHTGYTTANEALTRGIEDLDQVSPDAKAILFAGDLTMFGMTDQMGYFYRTLKSCLSSKIEGVFLTLGNHDIRGGDPTYWEDIPSGPNAYYSTIYNCFMDLNRPYMGDTDGRIYYDQWIDGYHFIVLNPEDAPKDYAWLSDEQLAWLDEKLSENESPDRPAFVTIHQPLNNTHCKEENLEIFGPQDQAIKQILQKHPQTVLFTGHLHGDSGYTRIIDSVYGTLVDVPCFYWTGESFEVYVYDSEIVIRPRQMDSHRWLDHYMTIIRLDTLPSLVKQSESLRQEEYSPASWNAFSKQIADLKDEAKSHLDLYVRNYTQQHRAEINQVQIRLKAALDGLEMMNALDTSLLETLIEKCDEIDLSGYVEAGQAEFLQARSDAREILDSIASFSADSASVNDLPSQKEINSCRDILHDALLALRLSPVVSSLSDLK